MSKADVFKDVPQKQEVSKKKYQRIVPGIPTKFLVKLNLRSVGGTYHCITQYPWDYQSNASKGGIQSL
jgi:hypothetical protein